jgi:hypothetical protein
MKLFERGVSVKSDEALAEELLRDYVFGEGEWAIGGPALHNCILGDTVESIIDGKFHSPPKAELAPGIPHNLPIKIGIIGYPFSGKATHALRLQEKYKLDKIELRELIKTATETDEDVREILLSGGVIDDDICVELVVDAIRACENPNGYMLIDFPTTLP